MNKIEWFGEWFDSPYYHLLYKHRNKQEASRLIDGLLEILKPASSAKILDLACGAGRHAIYLNSKGYNVTGLDLSKQSIKWASQHENESLRFMRQDMRDSFGELAYDFIFNLFTSFGYFDTKEEHQTTINNVASALKSNGVFIIDYLNTYRVVHDLVPEDHLLMEGVNFTLRKYMEDDAIIKEIEIIDGEEKKVFREKVRAIRKTEFAEYFSNAGLEILNVFGDYNLNLYDKPTSDRMIYVTRKI